MTYEEYMKNFDAKSITREVVSWIRNWFAENGLGCNAVVGISGGKDSSVVAALCQIALGSDRVIGVLMPNGEQSDIDDSMDLVRHLGIRSLTINISGAVNSILAEMQHAESEQGMITQQTIINLPARIRMATLYAVSQSNNGRVANTCNLSEDWVGYSTRWGDSVGDFSPLASFTTDEVVEIGMACGLPEYLVKKAPSDGLCGKTDEENLGFSYRDLNRCIRSEVLQSGPLDVDVTDMINILELHKKNKFKSSPIPEFFWEPTIWGIKRTKEFCEIERQFFFEVKDAELFGGKGSVGYTSVKVSYTSPEVIMEIFASTQGWEKAMLSQIRSVAEYMEVPVDCIRLISEDEYVVSTEEDDCND